MFFAGLVLGCAMGAAAGVAGTLWWGYANWKKQLQRQNALLLLMQLSGAQKPRCRSCGNEFMITQVENSLTRDFCNECMRKMDFTVINTRN